MYSVLDLVQRHDISHIPFNNRICDVICRIVIQIPLLIKILNYAYVLKNGVDRNNIFFFYFYTKLAESSFLCRFRIESVNVLFNSTIRFVPTLSRMSSLSGLMNIARVNIGFFIGYKKIKQRRISFVLGYLRMILWKISTTISIKHRILATYDIKKNQLRQPVCL